MVVGRYFIDFRIGFSILGGMEKRKIARWVGTVFGQSVGRWLTTQSALITRSYCVCVIHSPIDDGAEIVSFDGNQLHRQYSHRLLCPMEAMHPHFIS